MTPLAGPGRHPGGGRHDPRGEDPRPDAPVLIGGGDAAALAATLEAELARRLAGVVSFGLCGALDPALKVGDLVIGEAVADGADCYAADAAWIERIAAVAARAPGAAASPAPSGRSPASPRRPSCARRTGARRRRHGVLTSWRGWRAASARRSR